MCPTLTDAPCIKRIVGSARLLSQIRRTTFCGKSLAKRERNLRCNMLEDLQWLTRSAEAKQPLDSIVLGVDAVLC